SAQVRKDLSFFGSFGKRGLGYSVPELTARLRDILGLKRTYRVVLVGAGRIGGALVQYPGFRQRGFHVAAIYDRDPRKVGSRWNGEVGTRNSETRNAELGTRNIRTGVRAASDLSLLFRVSAFRVPTC